MSLTQIVTAAGLGYIVGTIPTDELASRLAAGRSDAPVVPGGGEGVGGEVATIAAATVKALLAAGFGARIVGWPGAIAAAGASVAGDHFPPWRWLPRSPIGEAADELLGEQSELRPLLGPVGPTATPVARVSQVTVPWRSSNVRGVVARVRGRPQPPAPPAAG